MRVGGIEHVIVGEMLIVVVSDGEGLTVELVLEACKTIVAGVLRLVKLCCVPTLCAV